MDQIEVLLVACYLRRQSTRFNRGQRCEALSQRGGAAPIGVIGFALLRRILSYAAERCESALGLRLSAQIRMRNSFFLSLAAIRRFFITQGSRLWLWWVVAALLLVVDQLTATLQVISAQTGRSLQSTSALAHFRSRSRIFLILPSWCSRMGLFVGCHCFVVDHPLRASTRFDHWFPGAF